MNFVQPSIFIGHGTPMLALAEDDFTESLKKFARGLTEKPRAIVVLSAHGTSDPELVEINARPKNQIFHDFNGFPGELYQIEYPAPGNPSLAGEIAGLLSSGGFQTALSTSMWMDHGVWVPLRIAFPEADIPVVQISMGHPIDPRKILKIGKLLSSLRKNGILLMGSGGVVHNLQQLRWHSKNERGEPWAIEFEQWVKTQLGTKNVEAMLDFANAPGAQLAAPTDEHFIPIFFTLGAALPGDEADIIFEGIQYGTLSMLSFALTHYK